MKTLPCAMFAILLSALPGCSGSNGNPSNDTPVGPDTPEVDVVTAQPRTYAGSASYGDLVVFSVDPAAHTCQVVNETTGQTANSSFTVLEDDLKGVYEIRQGSEVFYAVELADRLFAASIPTGNPDNSISFGVSGTTDNIANQKNIPGDYVFITISGQAVNGSTDIKEWGVLSIIDDGTFRVKHHATASGPKTGMVPLAPEEFDGAFPVETPDLSGTWTVDSSDPVRLRVQMTGLGSLTGFAYAPDPNAIFVLDLGEGNGFVLALKILPTMTIANLAGEYKFINVWNGEKSSGRSAGKAAIAIDGTGSYGHRSTDGSFASGVLEGIAACPAIPNMFHATSTETTVDENGSTVHHYKHYFVLLPYAYMGFNFRTDNGFEFVGYSVGARLD